MLSRPLPLLLALAAAHPARAGDFQLVIQRDPGACPDRYATARASPRDAAADLLSAFQGSEPHIPALRAIVMNGFVSFCTRQDRLEFDGALVEIGTQPRLVHERKYADFILMLATDHLVEELRARLQRADLAPRARRRLEHLRDEAPRWIAYRRTGHWPPRPAPPATPSTPPTP